MINSQIKGVVSNVHFCRTVTSEFLVIKYWTTCVVCCLGNRIECYCVTITAARLWFSFWLPNWTSLPLLLSFSSIMSPHFSFILSSGARKPKWSVNNFNILGLRARNYPVNNPRCAQHSGVQSVWPPACNEVFLTSKREVWCNEQLILHLPPKFED